MATGPEPDIMKISFVLHVNYKKNRDQLGEEILVAAMLTLEQCIASKPLKLPRVINRTHCRT